MNSDALNPLGRLAPEQRVQDLEKLVQVVSQINRSLDPEDVLTTSLTGVQSVLDADFGCFVLLNPETHALELAHGQALPAPLRARLENFVRHYSPQVDFIQPQDRIQIVSEIGRRLSVVLDDADVANSMLIPLLTHNRLIGVLFFGVIKQKLLAPKSVDLLMSIGEQVAMAIENTRLHAQLKRSEEWHREFIENSLEAFWEGDGQGRILFVNNAACRMIGLEREEILKKHPSDFFVYDDQAKITAAESLREKKIWTNPHGRLRAANGQIKIISITTIGTLDSEGQMQRYQSIFHDVTEREQLLESSRQRNKELAALNAIAQILSNPLEMGKALDQVCEQVTSITGLETAAIYLIGESAMSLNIAAYRGFSDALLPQVRSLGLDDSTTRQIFSSGEPFVLNEKTYPAEGFAGPRAEGYLTGISVPLRRRGNQIGALLVGSKTKHEFGQSDVDLMQNISRQIGVALDNADLFAQMQRRVQELDGLAQLSAACVRNLDVQSIANATVECAAKLIDADFVILRLREQDQLRLAAFRSKHNIVLREYVKIDDAIEQIVRMPSPVAVKDIDTYPMAELLRQNFRNDRIRALVIVPMIVDNKVVGTFAIAHETPYAWKPDQIDLANTMGNQVSVALQNALNYHQAQRRLKELEGLAQLSAACISNLDVQSIAQAAVKATSELLPVTVCSVRLLDGAEMRLVANYSSKNVTLPPLRTIPDLLQPAVNRQIPILLNDVDKVTLSDELRATFFLTETRAVLFVPLTLHEHTIGILIIGYPDPHEWQTHEVDLVQTIANHMAGAIDSAQLFQNVLSEQRKVQAIFDSGLSGLYATDAAGRMVMFNRAAERMTGWTLKEIYGSTWQEIFSDPTQTPPIEPLINEALLRKQTAFAYEGRSMRTRDGRAIPVAKAIAPLLDDKDNVTGAVGAFWDLTREQAAEMERDEFLRLAAHQIRTPLTALLSALQLYERPNLPEERRLEMWTLISSQGERLRRFASQFLDFESTVKSERELHMEPLPIVSTLRKLVKEFRADPGKHIFSIKPIKPVPMVYADLDRVEHILRNLFDNAVSYSPKGSHIQLAVSIAENDMIQVAVKDEGPGIPLTEQEKIFKPFYRSPDTTSRSAYGHGLGLSIARGFAREMGGDIWVESEIGRGTSFYVTLRRYR